MYSTLSQNKYSSDTFSTHISYVLLIYTYHIKHNDMYTYCCPKYVLIFFPVLFRFSFFLLNKIYFVIKHYQKKKSATHIIPLIMEQQPSLIIHISNQQQKK